MSHIPREILDEPNPARLVQLLAELAEEARQRRIEAVFERVWAHGGPGAYGAYGAAARELDMKVKAVQRIVERNPHLRLRATRRDNVTRSQ